jgi:hypothetical protein
LLKILYKSPKQNFFNELFDIIINKKYKDIANERNNRSHQKINN